VYLYSLYLFKSACTIAYLWHNIILVFLLKKYYQVEGKPKFYSSIGIDIIQIFYNLNGKFI